MNKHGHGQTREFVIGRGVGRMGVGRPAHAHGSRGPPAKEKILPQLQRHMEVVSRQHSTAIQTLLSPLATFSFALLIDLCVATL